MDPSDSMKPSHHLFAVRDIKTNLYGLPFHSKSLPAAIRDVTTVTQDPKSTLARFPTDYALFRVGQYFEEIGFIEGLDHPEFVCEISSLIPEQKA